MNFDTRSRVPDRHTTVERPLRVVIGRPSRAAYGQKQTLAGDFPKLPSAQLRLKCIIDA
jgi:hypothetical protein